MYATRLQRLQQAVTDAGLAAVAAIPGPNLAYLTGLAFHLSERPVVLFIPAADKPVLVVPALEAGKAAQLPFAARHFSFSDDDGPDAAYAQARAALALDGLALDGARLGVEGRRCRFLELALFGDARPVAADAVFAELRMRKSPDEIAAMRRAAEIAEAAFTATLPVLRPGVTERAVAAELVAQLLRHGSSPDFPFTPLVGSGPNGADPHLFPTDRQIAAGELVVMDWGANHDGYMSDITRTVAVGEPADAGLREVHALVHAANRAARRRAGPGVTAGAVDLAARQLIAKAGYGDRFIHRTGHGLGLEGHEEPYIKENSDFVLGEGMTFTIEPGIYLPGRGGVRIEDDMVITADGCESLSTLPRELQNVG